MTSHTTPTIARAQNTVEAQRLIAAQARLYTDVKRDSNIRVWSVVLIAVALITLAVAKVSDPAVGTVGGILVLVLQIVLAWRERRKVALASAIQEQFDTNVFQLPWNEVLVRERPSGQDIATSASRYKGDRTTDWYPPTGTVVRPLDILICQQSNVGWGIPVHRMWAWTVVCISATAVFVLGFVWRFADFSPFEGVAAIVVPCIPVLWEIVEIVRTNFASANEKSDVQQLMLDDWSSALQVETPVPIERCRLYQDRIVAIRRTNAHVPDWFDHMLRARNERAMRTTSSDMVEAARRANLA